MASADGERERGITAREMEEVEQRSSPRTPVIYETVRRLGEEEMGRPAVSLWWSGVAAGMSISFSLLAQSMLELHLPDEAWRPLITSFGYCVGFLMVVLARQQLFTESTITVVLPVFADFKSAKLTKMLRLWGIVLAANLTGTAFAAAFCTFTPVISDEVLRGMIGISRHAIDHPWLELVFRGIAAGFLIAAMVWLIPGAEGNQFQVIVLMTYLVGLGGFAHIVAGSVEAFLLVLNGELGLGTMFVQFIVPTLIGNIIGGTALFAMISYAQVMGEI